MQDFFKSAATIGDDVIMDKVNIDDPVPSLPVPSNLVHAVNRCQQNLRLQDPADLNFDLTEDFLPADFFRKHYKTSSLTCDANG